MRRTKLGRDSQVVLSLALPLVRVQAGQGGALLRHGAWVEGACGAGRHQGRRRRELHTAAGPVGACAALPAPRWRWSCMLVPCQEIRKGARCLVYRPYQRRSCRMPRRRRARARARLVRSASLDCQRLRDGVESAFAKMALALAMAPTRKKRHRAAARAPAALHWLQRARSRRQQPSSRWRQRTHYSQLVSPSSISLSTKKFLSTPRKNLSVTPEPS